jgi:hypothetical protein
MSKDTKETIIIKAPTGTKSRWVHESQAAGVKLSDWVCLMLQEQMLRHCLPKPEGRKNEQR